MLIRLFLALMLAVGAMPMGAPCHGAVPAEAQRAMTACDRPAPGGGHHPLPAEHGCIGCAALDDWLAERLAAPLSRPGLAPAAWQPRLAVRATAPPMLRPPRAG